MRQWFSRLSLTQKSLLSGCLVGLLLWLVLHTYHARQLQQRLDAELNRRLQQDAEQASNVFYEAVERHAQLAKTLAQFDTLRDYMGAHEGVEDAPAADDAWVPASSLWRNRIYPSAFVLFDRNGHFVTAHRVNPVHALPQTLRQQPQTWIAQGREGVLLTEIEGHPALLATAPLEEDGRPFGYFVIYAQIDDTFLSRVLLAELRDREIAVLLNGSFGPQKVMASSNPQQVPVGAGLHDLRGRYALYDAGIFDEGDWQLTTSLALMTPKTVSDPLFQDISRLAQREILFATLMYVAVFTLLFVLLGRRVQKIADRMRRFSQQQFHGEFERSTSTRDAIDKLANDCQLLQAQMLADRQRIQQLHADEKRHGQLQLLHAITVELGVGVLEVNGDLLVAGNSIMEAYLREVGDPTVFQSDTEQVEVTDRYGRRRFFSLGEVRVDTQHAILVRDVTKLEETTLHLQQMALHDPLTELPNRVLLSDRIEAQIRQSMRSRTPFSLFLMDLDNFKLINDNFGHGTGDQVLCKVSQRLAAQLRESDTLARLGGDEFAVLLPDTDREGAKQVAEHLIAAQQSPLDIDSQHLDLGLSIGIVTYPEHGATPELLLSHADIAMYHAKRNHLGQAFYTEGIDLADTSHLALSAELRQALNASDQLELWYQPQLDLQEDRIIRWEALIRWRHPQRGIVPPDQFIPLAEQTGLIREITAFVLERAIADCAAWLRHGQEGGVAINMSPQDCAHDHMIDCIDTLLKTHGLDSDKLVLEITEGSMMADPAHTRRLLTELDRRGVAISVDDFGTGYSSLGYLKSLPVSEIKVDKSFVQDMLHDPHDRMIVQAIIGLAQNLGMKVVAEGVENEDQLRQLQQQGCDIVQGYYLGRPVQFNEMKDLKIPRYA